VLLVLLSRLTITTLETGKIDQKKTLEFTRFNLKKLSDKVYGRVGRKPLNKATREKTALDWMELLETGESLNCERLTKFQAEKVK